jgi:nitroreductase
LFDTPVPPRKSAGPRGRHIAVSAATIALVAKEPEDERQSEWLAYDLGQATANMMLAAADLGIGSGHSALVDQEQAQRVLGFPGDYRRFTGTSIVLARALGVVIGRRCGDVWHWPKVANGRRCGDLRPWAAGMGLPMLDLAGEPGAAAVTMTRRRERTALARRSAGGRG